MYYFYVLLSQKDGKYYYGSTNNLRKRAIEHSNGKVTATQYRRPLRLVYYEAYETLRSARFREQQVKASGSVRIALHKRIIPIIPKGASPASRREALTYIPREIPNQKSHINLGSRSP